MQYVPYCLQVTNAEIPEVNGRYSSTGLQSFVKDKWILYRDGDYWKVSPSSDKSLHYFITSSKSYVSDVLVKKWTYSPVAQSAKFLPSNMSISFVQTLLSHQSAHNPTETNSSDQNEKVEKLQKDLRDAQTSIRDKDLHIASLEKELHALKEKSANVRTQLEFVLSRVDQPDQDSDTEEDSLTDTGSSYKYPKYATDEKMVALEMTVCTLTTHLTALMGVMQNQLPKKM